MTKVELFNKFLEDSDATLTVSFLFCKENYGLFFKRRNLACILSLWHFQILIHKGDLLKYCSEKLNTLFKHTCHYERIGVYFKEIESISTDLVVVYVIEILKCHFCGNMVENVLTKSIYKVDKEREDLINYINSLTKHKIPSELKYKLDNEGKYLYGQYNSIK